MSMWVHFSALLFHINKIPTSNTPLYIWKTNIIKFGKYTILHSTFIKQNAYFLTSFYEFTRDANICIAEYMCRILSQQLL
jgi:hypothetical protein